MEQYFREICQDSPASEIKVEVSEFIAGQTNRFARTDLDNIEQCVDEAVNNAGLHGGGGFICCSLTEEGVEVTVRSMGGSPYSLKKELAITQRRVDRLKTGGEIKRRKKTGSYSLGLHIIYTLSDYVRKEDGEDYSDLIFGKHHFPHSPEEQ